LLLRKSTWGFFSVFLRLENDIFWAGRQKIFCDGMIGVPLGLTPGLKPGHRCDADAALKRRSSTVLRALAATALRGFAVQK
jgi:hypothetical protein